MSDSLKPQFNIKAIICGFPLYWASLIAHLVKNLTEMQETLVQFLGLEDLLEKGKATHSSVLTWRIPWTTVHEQLLLHFSSSLLIYLILINSSDDEDT